MNVSKLTLDQTARRLIQDVSAVPRQGNTSLDNVLAVFLFNP